MAICVESIDYGIRFAIEYCWFMVHFFVNRGSENLEHNLLKSTGRWFTVVSRVEFGDR
jgi:hypothetical protein